MTALFSLVMASPLMKKILLYGSIAVAIILAYLGWRNKIENIGAQKVRLENEHAAAVATKKMLEAPVPASVDDTAKLLDAGRF